MKTNSTLSYYGSDGEVAARLASLINDRAHVTIPFVGGASIIQHLTARAIVANDLHELAINFYRVLTGRRFGTEASQQLIARCQSTLSHPSEIRLAEQTIRDSIDDLDRAWAFWTLCWVARKGKGGTTSQGGMPSVRRTAIGGTNASRLVAAAGDLPEWASHFQRCEWESIDFRLLLSKVADDDGCAIYCDPPWLGAGDKYLHKFSAQDHADLAAMLSRFKRTKVLVRYGKHKTIQSLYQGWSSVSAESRTQANVPVGEMWLLNM